jgi:hypothetical protein
MRLDVGSLSLWFSYKTVIAFSDGYGITVSENAWSSTTGKHLNWIDGGNKKGRLPRAKFEEELKKVLDKHGLDVKI